MIQEKDLLLAYLSTNPPMDTGRFWGGMSATCPFWTSAVRRALAVQISSAPVERALGKIGDMFSLGQLCNTNDETIRASLMLRNPRASSLTPPSPSHSSDGRNAKEEQESVTLVEQIPLLEDAIQALLINYKKSLRNKIIFLSPKLDLRI